MSEARVGRILLVGDELLGGTISDRNVRMITTALANAGVVIDRVEFTRDDRAVIAQAIRRLAEGADVLVVTGGLGPTSDDVTRDGVADCLGVPLVEDAAALERLAALMAARGLGAPSENVKRQAQFPRGASIVANPVGSAAGFRVRVGGCDLWSLPGVPMEASAMIDAVARAVGRPDVSWERTIATAGIGEVRVAERLEEGGFRAPPGARLAFLPGPGGVRVRVFAPGGLDAEVLDAAESEVRTLLGDWALPGRSIEESVVAAARARNRWLATAESCTGGLIGARITDVPGSSSVYLGGVVAYANEIKAGQLGVDPARIESEGAVSAAVAEAMAVGVRERFAAAGSAGSTIAAIGPSGAVLPVLGLSVTGVAGPGGGTAEKPVGTVWIGWADDRGAGASSFRFPGPREMVRERTVNKALEIAYRRLVESDG
ncbi:MAG: nicotinamide-nucleotide amidohydrolase family protein [bacterium]